MNLIDIIRNVPWTPRIGDPSLVGWFTVVVYFAAALLGGLVAWRERRGSRRRALLWGALTLLLLFLGINKQLDLQSWFTAVGRAVARAQGWYALRREVQFLFIVGVAAAGGGFLLTLGWQLRRELGRLGLVLLGLAGLLGFVLIRAASFHYVDLLINGSLLGVRLNWVLELGALGVLIAGLLRVLRGAPVRRAAARRRARGPSPSRLSPGWSPSRCSSSASPAC